jgi:hypothetical protein
MHSLFLKISGRVQRLLLGKCIVSRPDGIRYGVKGRNELIRSSKECRLWFLGRREPIRYSAPFSLSNEIPGEFKRYLSSFSLDRPFVCEVDNVNLMGPYATPVARDNTIIVEGTAWFRELCDAKIIGHLGLSSPPPLDGELDYAFVLLSRCSHEYYHWVTECLTSLQGLEHYREITCKKPPLEISNTPNDLQRESLACLDYPPGDLFYWDHRNVHVKHLVIASRRRYQPKRGVPLDGLSPSACRWLRDRVLAKADAQYPDKQPFRRIFISRQKASRRKPLNEDDVMAMLASYGFVRCFVEDLSFIERVLLFRDAEFVVGPHGAGLVYLIFSQKTSVIELFPSEAFVKPDFFQIARCNDFSYGFLINEAPDQDSLDSFVKVDDLRALLEKMLQQ